MHVAVFKYIKVLLVYIPNYSSCFPPGLYYKTLVFDLIFIWNVEGNLSDGGHDKVTWKRIRDLLTRCRDNVTLTRGGDVPQPRYWVFHLGLTGDVVDTYHWDVLVTSQRGLVGCFIWDLLETSWRRTDETLLLRPLETSSRRSNKMSWRRTTETS